MQLHNRPSWVLMLMITLKEVIGADDDYNVVHRDGSYQFGYSNPDSYHYADANRNNIVKGEFGGRNPGTGAIDSTIYTAGPRGFRPRGKNVVRKYDLNQNEPRPVGSRDDPYYDPYEDPSYSFSFATGRYNRKESANRVGDVNGAYSYTDDVGERHHVEFIAGKNIGFHVKTPFPDSNPRAYGPLYFNGRGKPIPRGRTSIQRGLDGSYRFVSAGPDQRRTETSDSTGHVRGSYTYLDDKGVQHSVHYIAGPETGYRVLKQVKGPHLPSVFPFGRPEIIPPDFYDYSKDTDTDVFDTAASGHVKPIGGKPGTKEDQPSFSHSEGDSNDEISFGTKISSKPPTGKPPSSFEKPSRPTYEDREDTQGTDDFGDLFGNTGTDSGGGRTSTATTKTVRPPIQGSYKPGSVSKEDDGSYKSSEEDGSYRPSQGDSNPPPSYGSNSKPGGDDSKNTTPGSRPSGNPSDFGSNGGGKSSPGLDEEDNSNDVSDDSGLFGSESNNARPPYSGRPIIHIGASDESCRGCKGTIVTNVGDKLFTVPPGVSVRAHVQSIDLLPIIPTVPSPSEQYKADIGVRTEQLNEATNDDVSLDIGDSKSEVVTTETTITLSANSTNT